MTKNQLVNLPSSKVKEDIYSEAGVSNDSSLSEVSLYLFISESC